MTRTTRPAGASTVRGRRGRAVIDPIEAHGAPVAVLLPPALEDLAAHVADEHGWPTHVIADASLDELRTWHDGEHRHRDAPKDPAKAHAGHLRHRHDPRARRAATPLVDHQRRKTARVAS